MALINKIEFQNTYLSRRNAFSLASYSPVPGLNMIDIFDNSSKLFNLVKI